MADANRAIMALENQIFRLASEPPDEKFIETPDFTCDEHYCPKCIGAALAAEKAKHPDGADVYVAQGSGENDSSLHCDSCGCLLAYSLTDYGASYELDHFTKARGWSRKSLHPDVAFELCAMLRVVACSEKLDDIFAAIRVGNRAVKAMSRAAISKATGAQ